MRWRALGGFQRNECYAGVEIMSQQAQTIEADDVIIQRLPNNKLRVGKKCGIATVWFAPVYVRNSTQLDSLLTAMLKQRLLREETRGELKHLLEAYLGISRRDGVPETTSHERSTT
jgi:hypothetical protein